MNKIFQAAIMSCAMLVASTANSQERYKCEFRTDGTNGWVPSWIWVHAEQGKTHVFHWFMKKNLDGAMLVKDAKPFNGRKIMSWSLDHKSTRQDNITAKYKLAVAPDAKMKSSVAITLNNAISQREAARGTCKTVQSISQSKFLAWAKKEAASTK